MTLSPRPLASPPRRPVGPARRWRVAASVFAALVLGACTSTPLPPWPTQGARVVAPPRAKAPVVSAQTLSDQAVGSPVVTPVTGPQDQLSGTELIESAAVAAHFPDPPVRYDTPGLGPDRRAWTTNAELAQWLDELARSPAEQTRAQKIELGTSQAGTPIAALALSGASGGKSLESNGRPTVLLVGQQHGDEPASGEALLVMARELSHGLLAPMLQRINVIIVPRANPDGATVGSHATSDGTDLDRDHLSLRTPEAQALAQAMRAYRPAVIVDVHEYPVQAVEAAGARLLPSQDLLLQAASTANVPDFITKAAMEWVVQPLTQSLAADGLTHEWWHTLTPQGNALVAETGDAQPVSLRNLGGLDNAVSLAIASRGAGLGRAHAQRRVHSLVVALTSVLRSTADRGNDLQQVRTYVMRDIASKACQGTLTVQAGPTTSERDLGLINEADGALTQVKVQWTSTASLRPEVQRPRPCGYWLSADSAAPQALGLLGLQVMRIAEDGSVLTESFPGGGSTNAALQAVRTTTDVPAGSYYVGLNQSLANVAAAALEPGTPFSYQGSGLLGAPGASTRVINNPSLVFEASE